MFLRWTKYRDRQGRVRLYGQLLSSRREGRRVRHDYIGALRVCIQADINRSPDETRDLWRHLDYVLARYRAAEAGARPEP